MSAIDQTSLLPASNRPATSGVGKSFRDQSCVENIISVIVVIANRQPIILSRAGQAEEEREGADEEATLELATRPAAEYTRAPLVLSRT